MEPQQDDDLEFSRVVFLLKRRAWVPLVVAVIAAMFAFAYSTSQPKLYKADVEVNAVDQGYGVFRNNADPSPQRDVDNAVYLVGSRSVLNPTMDQLGPLAASVRSIEGSTGDTVDVVTITAVASSPEAAAQAANTAAAVFIEQQDNLNVQARKVQANQLRGSADQIQDQVNVITLSLTDAEPNELEALKQQKTKLVAQQADLRTRANDFDTEAELRSGAVRVLSPAEVPTTPFEPKPARDAAVAGLVGLLLGVAIVILADWINSRVSAPEEVSRLAGSVPIVGLIPLETRRLRRHRLPSGPRAMAEPGSAAEEAYRALATNIKFAALGRESTIVAVTSASEGEGKTTTVANLAMALVASGSRVAVVSADLRRPSLGEVFGVPESSVGLTTVLLGERGLSDVATSIPCKDGASLLFVPTGPVPSNPQAALGSDAMGAVLSRLSQAGAEIILLDTAPVLPVSDTLALVLHCDAVLLCVVPNGTKKAYLREAMRRLQRMEANVVGISLDGVRAETLDYYGSSYSSDTSSGSGSATSNGSSAKAKVPGRGVSEAIVLDKDDAAPVGTPRS